MSIELLVEVPPRCHTCTVLNAGAPVEQRPVNFLVHKGSVTAAMDGRCLQNGIEAPLQHLFCSLATLLQNLAMCDWTYLQYRRYTGGGYGSRRPKIHSYPFSLA